MPPVQDLPLRDIHLPEQISWFPPALGWWLLIIFVPILSYFLIAWLQKIFRKTAVKDAQKLLLQLQNNTELSPLEKVVELSTLLRRVAISIESKKDKIAGLTGRAWLDYLDNSLENAPFKNGVGRCLADAPYQKELPINIDLGALFEVTQKWLKAQK
jgi:hypothetical protein